MLQQSALRQLCLMLVCLCLLFSLSALMLDATLHDHQTQDMDCATCALLHHLQELQRQLRLVCAVGLLILLLPACSSRPLGQLCADLRASVTPVSLGIRCNH